MKKIFIVVVCILFTSCVLKQSTPSGQETYTPHTFDYTTIKNLKTGERGYDTTGMYVWKIKAGYIVRTGDGGTVFITNEEF